MNESELQTLLPEATVTIDGGKVTLHEYTFTEGLQVDRIAQPLIDGLQHLFLDGDAEDLAISELSAVFGEHPQIMVQMLAISTGQPEEWVAGLDDNSGQVLLMAWWTVNRHFFVRRLVKELAKRQAVERAESSTGESASPG